MERLKELPNIGPEIEKQLNQVGIKNKADLEFIGSREAWQRIHAIDPSACYNKLLALEGAIRRINKNELTQAEKNELKIFYSEQKI